MMNIKTHTDEEILTQLNLTREEVKRTLREHSYSIYESFEEFSDVLKNCGADEDEISASWELLEQVVIDGSKYYVERFQ